MARRERKAAGKGRREWSEKARAAFDRLNLVLTLVIVSVFAIFTGYLVGQYAVHYFAEPLIVTERPAASGTRVVDDSGASPAPVVLSPSPAQTANQAASRAPAASSGPAAGAAAQQAPAPSGGAPAAPAAVQAPPSSSPAAGGQAAASGAASRQGQVAATVYRVHVGHFRTRDEAVRVADALKTGTPAVPDAWVLRDAATGEYRVQAGAFSSLQRARDFAEQLISMGHDAYIAQ